MDSTSYSSNFINVGPTPSNQFRSVNTHVIPFLDNYDVKASLTTTIMAVANGQFLGDDNLKAVGNRLLNGDVRSAQNKVHDYD